MKGSKKQPSIFLDAGRKLTTGKPQTKAKALSFFHDIPSNTYSALPSTAPHVSSTKNSIANRRKVSLPVYPKKVQMVPIGPAVQTGQTVGMNDQFLHTRKESYLNSQFNMRKNRLREISKQNKQIYGRISSQKSVYSSQQLNKSFEMNNEIKKRMSSSKLSQRSNSSRLSDGSRSSKGRNYPQGVKKKQVKMQIKTTNLHSVRDKELKGFKAMFSMGNQRNNSEQNKPLDRNSVKINSFRKNDIYDRPNRSSKGNRTIDIVHQSEKQKGMGGLLHRIAEELSHQAKRNQSKNQPTIQKVEGIWLFDNNYNLS